MADDNSLGKQLAEAQQVVSNLQSACNELQAQNQFLSSRCATTAVERDNALRYAKSLEEAVKKLNQDLADARVEAGDEHADAAVPTARKTKNKAA